MGKTIPSFLFVLEDEIYRWKRFRHALASEEEKQAFDEIMDMCRSNSMAAGNACNPIIFEPMAMSILLGQQIKIQKMERKLHQIKNNQPK